MLFQRKMLAISFLFLFTGTVILGKDSSIASKKTVVRPQIGAPVLYSDAIAILTDDQGVACVAFDSPKDIELGVTPTSGIVGYRYRYQSHDGRETAGSGYLYEKYRKDVVDDKSFVVDEGGKLKMIVGHFQVDWSEGDIKQGWLYYTPETMRLQFASSSYYDKLELSRFAQ